MLFGVFSRCDSMGEICDGMMAMQGKLNHLGLEKSPAKSTAGDGLRERDNDFFKDFYNHYHYATTSRNYNVSNYLKCIF